MNETDEQTIADLKAKLTERDARIAALEKELASLKARQFPSFITQSTFVRDSV
jgi:predicted RNase H-like nuclease (RuvC/YqgF family)